MHRMGVFAVAVAAIIGGPILYSEPASAADGGAYEGQIEGEFKGWEGETIYKLMDGHIIQQAAYHYHYHYAYSPKVVIYQSRSGGLKIHVIGDEDEDVAIKVLK